MIVFNDNNKLTIDQKQSKKSAEVLKTESNNYYIKDTQFSDLKTLILRPKLPKTPLVTPI